MSNELSIQNLLPSVSNIEVIQDKIKNSTFIGIDFGTSTTVVSYAILGDETTPIKTDTIPIKQLNIDGGASENHLVPSCIAFSNDKLFIGQTAKLLKSKLHYGKNLWYSFKMELGEDNGSMYYNTELPQGNPYATIENPLDATKVFLSFLKKEIDQFLLQKNLPLDAHYSVSIPASFEANQRKDLKEALNYAGIPFQDNLFIDEPNAAFLSYLMESNSNQYRNYNIPLDSPLHILVFDFGAGTCDISILEIGRKQGKLYSKNIAISKYEQLGGDDIDKQIVKQILFPQLLKENNLTKDDIRTPEYEKIILPKLQPIAEFLKVKICKSVSANMIDRAFPSMATSNQRIKFPQTIPDILLPQYKLKYTTPDISFEEFSKVMDNFIQQNEFQHTENTHSIFSVIESAMQKANLNKDYIDLVLFVGGSSYNPYIQNALKEYFIHSEMAIPKDLQSLVSTGAGVNSFLQNGLNIDMISPIVSEPILILLQNKARVIVKEGTEIPYKGIVIEDLHPQKDNQYEIEIPICVSSSDKILNIIKIKSDVGFNKTDNIRLECDITHDKLIHFKAFIRDLEVQVEPINPFANRALTTEEIAEKRLLKIINNNAKENGGKPSAELLKQLASFYRETKNYLKVAETYEVIQALKPNERYENNICYNYSKAGKEKLSDKWAEIAYQKDKCPSNIHNYALRKEKEGDIKAYEELLEEAIRLGGKASCVTLGEHLLYKGDSDRAMELFRKAFDYYYSQYQRGFLDKDQYYWLIKAANYIDKDIAEEVKLARDNMEDSSHKWFNTDNLASDDSLTDLLPF